MSETLIADVLSWLATYALHSTALLATAWLITRHRRVSPAAAEIMWKSALVGGILTASLQLWLDLRPVGSLTLASQPAVISAPPALRVAPSVRSVHEQSEPREHAVIDAAASSPVVSSESSLPTSKGIALSLWLLTALALAGTYAARRLILMGRLGDREHVTQGSLYEMLRELAQRGGVRVPSLTVTTRLSSPVALGFREICLPTTVFTGLDEEQQRSMLAHELAHIARRDPLWLVIASIVERVLWFQPLNRVARRELATVAEFLSDDWAVQRTGSGEALARCLAQVAEWIQASPLGVPVAGMAEERSLLVTRVARLLENSMTTMTKRRVFALATVAVLLATVVMVPSVAGKTAPSGAGDVNGIVPSQDSSRVTRAHAGADAEFSEPAAPMGEDEMRALSPADSAVVLALIARLKDEDAEVRAAAIEALAKLGDRRAVAGILETLKDPDARVRVTAAEALAEFHDRRAIPGLQSALLDNSVEVQKHALEALGNFSDGGGVPTAAVVKLMEGTRDLEIVHGAIHLLADLHDRSVAPNIRPFLASSNSEVREAAIKALAELNDEASSAAIVQRLGDSDSDVREAAISALDELHARIPDATMIALLKDNNADVRQRAAQLAGERSMTGAVSALVALLDDPNSDVRTTAVEALANIADESARNGLKKALTSKDSKVRKSAVEALGDRRP